MDKEVIEQVTQYLDKIGEKIGATGQQIWPWLVKQQYIEAIICLVAAIFTAVAFGLSIKCLQKQEQKDDKDDLLEIVSVIGIFVLGLGFIVATAGIFIECFDIFNPEYWALKDLVYMVKP